MLIPAMVMMMAGCGEADRQMEQALAFRSKLLGASQTAFTARIRADYIDHAEEFTLKCSVDGAGVLTFEVTEPSEISGITGGVSGETGNLSFDDTVLAFPLMADQRLSPVSGPWVLIQAMRSGYLTACVQEGELLHVTVDDRYASDPLTLEIWIRGEEIVSAEIAWRGIRQMTLELEDYRME